MNENDLAILCGRYTYSYWNRIEETFRLIILPESTTMVVDVFSDLLMMTIRQTDACVFVK